MTREEAKHIVDVAFSVSQAVRRDGEDRTYHEDEIREAKNMAIQALSQEPTKREMEREYLFQSLCEDFKKLQAENDDLRKRLEQEPCDDAIDRAEAQTEIMMSKSITAFDRDLWIRTKDAVHILRELPSVTQKSGKWIPVSERLPEDEQEILFSTKTGRVHSGKYHDDGSANQWYSHRDKCRAWNNVVNAWMPLPEPYDPQESEVSK